MSPGIGLSLATQPHLLTFLPQPRLLSFAGYLTCYPVWAELPETQRGLDPPQQGHHIQVLDSAPVGRHID